MAKSIESIIKRAQQLGQKTAPRSISPKEVGDLHVDTLEVIEQLNETTNSVQEDVDYIRQDALPVKVNGSRNWKAGDSIEFILRRVNRTTGEDNAVGMTWDGEKFNFYHGEGAASPTINGKKIATTEDVPTKISELTNDIGLITEEGALEMVQELADELSAEISKIPRFGIKVVENLPTQNISTTTVYLVPDTDGSSPDLYTEYIYVDGKWEQLGKAKVNLSEYYTSSEVDLKLQSKVDKEAGKGLSTNDYTTADKNKVASALPFNDTYCIDANGHTTNGYIKVGKYSGNNFTQHIPSVCTGDDRWGILFFIAENAADGTGTQMYFPIDGTYKGRVFTRSLTAAKKTGQSNYNIGEWTMLTTSKDLEGVVKTEGNQDVTGVKTFKSGIDVEGQLRVSHTSQNVGFVRSTSADGARLQFRQQDSFDSSGTVKGVVGVDWKNGIIYISPSTSSPLLGVTFDGKPQFWNDANGTNKYELYHEGNLDTSKFVTTTDDVQIISGLKVFQGGIIVENGDTEINGLLTVTGPTDYGHLYVSHVIEIEKDPIGGRPTIASYGDGLTLTGNTGNIELVCSNVVVNKGTIAEPVLYDVYHTGNLDVSKFVKTEGEQTISGKLNVLRLRAKDFVSAGDGSSFAQMGYEAGEAYFMDNASGGQLVFLANGNWNISNYSDTVVKFIEGNLSGDIVVTGGLTNKVVNVSGTTAELKPNRMYKFGTVNSLTITFEEEVSGCENEYKFKFTAGVDNMPMGLPDGIKWQYGVGAPVISVGHIYEISIKDNCATYLEFA